MIKVRVLADLTAYRLRQEHLTRSEAIELIVRTREEILALCPGKGGVFDLVLLPRFMRIADEKAPVDRRMDPAIN